MNSTEDVFKEICNGIGESMLKYVAEEISGIISKADTRAIVKEIVDGTEDGILKIMAEEIH